LHDKRVDIAMAGLSGDRFDNFYGGGRSFANLSYSTGHLDLSRNQADAAADALAYGTEGRFGKWNWGVTRLQKLPGAFTLYANLLGQTAQGNLGSSEQFILGGPYGIRAYSGGEAPGDSGWLANLELRYDIPHAGDLGKLQLFGFYDTGRIVLHQDTRALAPPSPSASNDYQLSGWGLGIQLNKTGSYSWRLVWAQKLGSNPGQSSQGMDADGRSDRSRLWITGALFF
jgi:hemolysin activation/secretion protein